MRLQGYKFLILSAFLFAFATQSMAQPCNNLLADLEKGTINGVNPLAGIKKVKKSLPCSTGETGEKEGYNCGGGVFFLNHDFFFYTGQDYIEVRSDFKGKTTKPVLGKTEAEIKMILGEPDKVINGNGENDNWLYRRSYGTLRITFNGKRTVSQFGMHAVDINRIELCL